MTAIAQTTFPVTPLIGDRLSNGGFESGSSPWVLNGPSVDSNCDAYSGSGCLAFTGTSTATQTFSGTPGANAILNFHYKAPGTGGSFKVTFNGNQLFSSTNEQQHDWLLKTYGVTFDAQNTIEFDTDTDAFNLDDVSIVLVPTTCSSSFYQFDPATGEIVAENGKTYPGPPQPSATFPAISDGTLEFKYTSPPIASTLPRQINLGMAKESGSEAKFDDTDQACRKVQSTLVQDLNCAGDGSMSATFPNLEDLVLAGCVDRAVATDQSTATYTANMFTIYQDAYTMDNHWSELDPIKWSVTVPFSSSATTTAGVDVVSDEVLVEYQPVEVINNGGSNPTIQFTTTARTFYPFVAFGSDAQFSASGGTPASIGTSAATDRGSCTLYDANNQVQSSTTFCDQNPGICTVQCVRTIPYTSSTCDFTGYTWEFDFQEYQDFTLPASASTLVSDSSLASFSRNLIFDTNSVWDICPNAGAVDYSQYTSAQAVHGHFDTSTGLPVADSSSAIGLNQPINFGFLIGLSGSGLPSGTKIFSAKLTQMVVQRPDGTNFYLVGSSSAATVGGIGSDVNRVTGLTFTPNYDGTKYPMTTSAQAQGTDPHFAYTSVSFVPNLGTSAGPNILYYSDSSTYSSGVTLTVSFTGTISLFADGSTPGKREIVVHNFLATRQLAISPNGTVANPTQLTTSYGAGNSTTIVIQIPSGSSSVPLGAIIGGAAGGVVVLLLALFFGFCCYRRRKKDSRGTYAATTTKEVDTDSF